MLINLLLSLAQIKNLDTLIATLVTGLKKLFPETGFIFLKADTAEPVDGIPLMVAGKTYGWVRAIGAEIPQNQRDAIENAFQILHIIIERSEQSQLLIEAQARQFDALQRENNRLREEVLQSRQIAAELQESKEIFTTFMEHNPAYVFFKDEQLRAVSLSKNYEQMLGRPLSELLGKTADELFPANLGEPMTAADRRIMEEGHPITIEEELNGHFYSTVKFPFITAGMRKYLAGFTIDITRLKVAEEELLRAKAIAEENEIRFKALHNASFGGIAIHDKGLILDCNQGLAEISGYSVQELIGMDGLLLIAEKTRPLVRSNIAAGYEKPYYAVGLRKNGEEFPLRLEAREIPYRGRRVRTVEFRDVTREKLSESIIASEKERLAVTLRSIGDGVITTDTSGNVIMVNRVAEYLTGWSQEEAQGQPLAKVFKVINEATREPSDNPVARVITTGCISELENHTVLVSKDGTERVIADSGAPIKDAESVTIGVVLVFRDMTEKQKLIDSLQRTDKLESIGVLAGGIAHDFNNLLSGVFSYIELARMATDTTKIVSYLDQALGVFERAKNLTGQLLSFAKGGTLNFQTGDLGPVIKDSAMFALSGSAINCEFDIAADLWPADFDRSQLEQTIDNLVINAQQAMLDGGKITIRVQNFNVRNGEIPLLKPGKYIRISVADTGNGMPASLVQRIFDPFFTTKQKGNGLGLSTCYAIVQKHAGMIDVASVMGKGSTFYIYIPASKNAPSAKEDPLLKVHPGHGRILIMDDEEFLRDIVSALLQSMGYDVVTARDGEEAVRLLTGSVGQTIDAAIFDLTIPGGMGGKDAIVHVRKKFPDLPVFVSSGYSEDPVMAQPQKYGFTASLCKPYRKADLAAILNRYIRPATSS